MKTHHVLLCLPISFVLACGGTPKKDTETTPVGESTAGSNPAGPADDLDVADGTGTDGTNGAEGSAEESGKSASDGSASVTFRLKNTYKDDLVLSLDKGYGAVIFAYSGKPPKAKSILMFPKHCTAACSAGASERCPVCEAPTNVKDIKAAEKREVIASGKSLDVPWDGQVYVYEDTDADGKSCKCFKRADVPPEKYTIKACGLRVTKSATKSTKIQCESAEATFPGDGAQIVELEFDKP